MKSSLSVIIIDVFLFSEHYLNRIALYIFFCVWLFFIQHHIFEVYRGLLVAIINSFLLLYYNWFYEYTIILFFVDILLSGLLQKMLLCTSAYMSWYFYVSVSLEYASWSKLLNAYYMHMSSVTIYCQMLYKMLLATLTILNIWCYSFNFSHSVGHTVV